MEKKHNNELHSEHSTWLNTLAFYQDDLKIMQKRLDEIAGKNTGKEVMALTEHFQNAFIVQQQNIDALTHKVKQHDQVLETDIASNPVASDHRLYPDHGDMREEINGFEKNFNEIRQEYIRFLARYM